MAICKYCGQPFIWIKPFVGKAECCEPGLVPYWKDFRGTETIVTEDGEKVRCWLDGEPDKITDVGHELHRAHCPRMRDAGIRKKAEFK